METQKFPSIEIPSDAQDKSAPLPRYYRIQKEIRKQVESGIWLPGEMIPPEKRIAEDFHVSLGTVRRAIQDLVADGLLYRMQGKGTLVAGTNLKREALRYYRFKKDFTEKEASHQIKVTDLERTEGRPDINRLLKVPGHMDLYIVKRIFIRSAKTIVYSISWLPADLVPGFEGISRHRLERVPLYLALENKYGIPTKENEELIDVAPVDAEAAGVLRVPEGTPLLRLEMLSYTYRKKPYEFRTSWCDSGSYRLVRTY